LGLFRRAFQLKNYYAILGIKEGASLQEIKKAYKRSVKKWHPDFHPDEPECLEKIKDINEAYEVLSRSKKRRAYLQQVKEYEINSFRQMAFGSHEDHPFFSYMAGVKEWMEKDSKKTEGD